MAVFLKSTDYTYNPGTAGVGNLVFSSFTKPEKLSLIMGVSYISTTGVETVIFDSDTTGTYDSTTGTLIFTTDTSSLTTGTLQVIVANSVAGYFSDPIATDGTNSWSEISLLKGILSNPTPAGEYYIGKTGYSIFNVSTTVQRPNDTTAYTAGDVVGNGTAGAATLTVLNVGRTSAGSGFIKKIMVQTDDKNRANRFRLHLWNKIVTPQGDNALYKHLYTDADGYIGYLDTPVQNSGSDTTNSTASFSINNFEELQYNLGVGNTNLYGILVTLDAYTPVALTSHLITITGWNC